MENNIVENKIKWVYLLGFFLILALPLLNLPPWFSPPDWGKTIVFRIILSLMIFVFLWQVLFQKLNDNLSLIIKNILNKQSKVFLSFWLLIAFLGVYFLATLFSQDPYFSFWGSPYRAGGFLNFAFCIIFAILAFLILRKSDWQKIWDFSIIIGIFVSFIAIFQQLGLFSKVVIPFSGRAPSTIGGPIFLAIYLLLLFFPILFFGIREKNLVKKFFYFFALLLFFYVILNTGSRAAYFGLLIGIFYFVLFYPVKFHFAAPSLLQKGGVFNRVDPHTKKLFLVKIFFGILLVLGILGVYYLNADYQVPQSFQENKIFKTVNSRLSISLAIKDPRFSSWEIAFRAMKKKPILGYGPENFSIGFDKHYDPSLPYIDPDWGSWYDRAHNFIFDIGVTVGILGLIIYLSLFAVLFSGLQKLKKIKPEKIIIYHGIQAAFLAYLAANFFSFDTFSTYLISFLIIAYSLTLINQSEKKQNEIIKPKIRSVQKLTIVKIWTLLKKYKKAIIVILFLFLIWFIWACNIKPFWINKEIRSTKTQSQIGNYQQGLKQLESVLDSHTYLDSYLRLNYVELISQNLEKTPPAFQGILVEKAINALKENTEIRPYYTRNWLLLGNYTNVLIEKGKKNLRGEAYYYFEKALQLSPKHLEIFIGLAKTDLLTNDYLGAKNNAQKCINLNSKVGECWWLMAITNIYLNNIEEAQGNIEAARKAIYPVGSKSSTAQLINAYNYIKNYEEIVKIYQTLILQEPNNAQYHFSLAVYYKELGNNEKAKKEALRALELMPEAKKQIEEFLKTL
ncbi:O-antigen ligase family protein [Candidatus Parcubacteria bacterium]|nr:O-antigen ligase family protein [Candidatus Parcubacteria bacterium]